MTITQLQVKEAIFITGVGTLGTTITSGAKSKYPDLSFQILEYGVKITVRGMFCLVPWGNIKNATGKEEFKPTTIKEEVKEFGKPGYEKNSRI